MSPLLSSVLTVHNNIMIRTVDLNLFYPLITVHLYPRKYDAHEEFSSEQRKVIFLSYSEVI